MRMLQNTSRVSSCPITLRHLRYNTHPLYSRNSKCDVRYYARVWRYQAATHLQYCASVWCYRAAKHCAVLSARMVLPGGVGGGGGEGVRGGEGCLLYTSPSPRDRG
eukprot:2706221-Rhodomonas_salina.2